MNLLPPISCLTFVPLLGAVAVLALGAKTGQVLGLILRGGLAIVAVAVILGLGGALAAGRLLESRLFNVAATDPLTMSVVPAVLGVAALLACWLPARRAARVDPAVTLRAE